MSKVVDAWLKDFSEATKLAEDIQGKIEDRNNVLKKGGDVTRLISSTRRKIAMLGTRIERLCALSVDTSTQLSEKESKRREELVHGLRNSVHKLTTSLNDGKHFREVLIGELKETSESTSHAEAVSKLDNRGLVRLQQQMMEDQDDALAGLESTVTSTKHIALAINSELDLQTRLLGELETDLDSTNTRMKAAQRRVLALTKQAGNTCSVVFVILGILAFTLIAVFLSRVASVF